MRWGAPVKDEIADDGGGSADQLIAAFVQGCQVGGCRRGAQQRRRGAQRFRFVGHQIEGQYQLGGAQLPVPRGGEGAQMAVELANPGGPVPPPTRISLQIGS